MNPWLDIPLEDYEAHMALASVGQAVYLARLLGTLVEEFRPRSVAIIGCAGGNGFEQLPPDLVCRVVGVDINPRYIETTRKRFEGRFQKLELLCDDFLSPTCAFEPVDLLFAGLVFEYVDYAKGLLSLLRLMKPGGRVSVVLQLPSQTLPAVSPTPYVRLKALEGLLTYVRPADFREAAVAAGLSVRVDKCVALGSGKSFHEFVFERIHT